MVNVKVWLSVVGAGLVSSSAAAGVVVFHDNFNSENGGTAHLLFFDFTQWTISDGSVDLIGNGFFDDYPGNGLYVDLDGTKDAATMTSAVIAVSPGLYQLDFDLGENPGEPKSNKARVSVGDAFSEVFTSDDAGVAPTFVSVQRQFLISEAAVSIVFDHEGGDSAGLYIDNVSLSLVPCPGDMNDDNVVGTGDLLILLGWWGGHPQGPPDLNGDGVVNAIDLIELLGNWGPCPK